MPRQTKKVAVIYLVHLTTKRADSPQTWTENMYKLYACTPLKTLNTFAVAYYSTPDNKSKTSIGKNSSHSSTEYRDFTFR